MKLVITTGIYPPDHGGPATFVPALASYATEQGWQVQVITLADEPEKSHDDQWQVSRIQRSTPKSVRVLTTVTSIAKSIRDSDVLFSNGLFEESAIAAKAVRRPWVVKFVGDPIWEQYRNRTGDQIELMEFAEKRLTTRDAARRFVLTAALRSSCLCLTPSRELQNLLTSWKVAPVEFLPNGVEICEPSQLPLDIDVLSICRLVPWKNLDVVIDACLKAKANLHIVGSGPEMEKLKKFASTTKSTSQVTFHGALPPTQVASLLDRSRIFVLNSSYEGMSFALLEAMARAKTVIVGSNRGNTEVVIDGTTGKVVNPRDSDELEDAIRYFLSHDEEARELGQNAQAAIENDYSLEKALARTMNAIESVSTKRP